MFQYFALRSKWKHIFDARKVAVRTYESPISGVNTIPFHPRTCISSPIASWLKNLIN